MKSSQFEGVEIKELTVGEIYSWLSETVTRDSNPDQHDHKSFINRTVMSECTLYDLGHMTSLTMKQMETLTPGTLDLIALECKEVNSGFFRAAALVRQLSTTVELTPQSNSTPSPTTSQQRPQLGIPES